MTHCLACYHGELHQKGDRLVCDRCDFSTYPSAAVDASVSAGMGCIKVLMTIAVAVLLLMTVADLGAAIGGVFGLSEAGGQVVLVIGAFATGLVWPRVGIVVFRSLGIMLAALTALLTVGSLIGGPDWNQVIAAGGMAVVVFGAAAFFYGHSNRRFLGRRPSVAVLAIFLAALLVMLSLNA